MLKPGQKLPGLDALDLKEDSVSEVAQFYPNQVSVRGFGPSLGRLGQTLSPFGVATI